jgi:ABC-type glutathione transport system ATPase component
VRERTILGTPRILRGREGAGELTPEDAELFSHLGRLEELKQMRSWVLDTDKAPVVAMMGESGVGKTSLLRAGLTFTIL